MARRGGGRSPGSREVKFKGSCWGRLVTGCSIAERRAIIDLLSYGSSRLADEHAADAHETIYPRAWAAQGL